MTRYRVMARLLHQRRHQQQGPEYETRAEAEEQAGYWDGVGGSVAHVELVPPTRPTGHHRGASI